MFLRGQCRKRDLLVRLIGRDDNDSIDFRIVQNVAVIHCSLFYAEFISCLMQKRFVEIAEHSKLGVRIVHNSLHMDLRHDAAGNDTNFEFLFHNSSLSDRRVDDLLCGAGGNTHDDLLGEDQVNRNCRNRCDQDTGELERRVRIVHGDKAVQRWHDQPLVDALNDDHRRQKIIPAGDKAHDGTDRDGGLAHGDHNVEDLSEIAAAVDCRSLKQFIRNTAEAGRQEHD